MRDPAPVEYSALRAAPRVSLVDQVPLPAPLSIFIEPTNVCNYKCSYCPESEPDFKDISGGWFHLEQDRFTHILDEIATLPSPPSTINFYMMGEPFVNKALPTMVRQAKDRGSACKIIVTSNGSLLTADRARGIIDSGLDYLRISIYGANEQTHRMRTNSAIRLKRVIENLRMFRALRGTAPRPFLYVKMIDPGDPRESAEFLDVFGPIADEVKLEPVMNWNDENDKNWSNLDKDHLLATPYFANRKDVCPFPFYTLVVHADLRVSVCCVDWSKKAVVGDLKEQTLLDIWNGPVLREFQSLHVLRRRHEIEACARCTFLHTAPDPMDGLTWPAWSRRTGAAIPEARSSRRRIVRVVASSDSDPIDRAPVRN